MSTEWRRRDAVQVVRCSWRRRTHGTNGQGPRADRTACRHRDRRRRLRKGTGRRWTAAPAKEPTARTGTETSRRFCQWRRHRVQSRLRIVRRSRLRMSRQRSGQTRREMDVHVVREERLEAVLPLLQTERVRSRHGHLNAAVWMRGRRAGAGAERMRRQRALDSRRTEMRRRRVSGERETERVCVYRPMPMPVPVSVSVWAWRSGRVRALRMEPALEMRSVNRLWRLHRILPNTIVTKKRPVLVEFVRSPSAKNHRISQHENTVG